MQKIRKNVLKKCFPILGATLGLLIGHLKMEPKAEKKDKKNPNYYRKSERKFDETTEKLEHSIKEPFGARKPHSINDGWNDGIRRIVSDCARLYYKVNPDLLVDGLSTWNMNLKDERLKMRKKEFLVTLMPHEGTNIKEFHTKNVKTSYWITWSHSAFSYEWTENQKMHVHFSVKPEYGISLMGILKRFKESYGKICDANMIDVKYHDDSFKYITKNKKTDKQNRKKYDLEDIYYGRGDFTRLKKDASQKKTSSKKDKK